MSILPLRVVTILMLFLSAMGFGVVAQSASMSTASSSSTDGLVEVSLGGFVFEAGARIALELVRTSNDDCFPVPPAVEELRLVDEEGVLLRRIAYEPLVDVAAWIGRLSLTQSEGIPLATGTYRALITTTIGTFTAELEVLDSAELVRLGRFSATASVCGLELRVYRILTQDDHGAALSLRRGDRLMVALVGNATTGFEWMNALVYEYAVLRATEEAEYRPTPSPQGMVGFGGEFLFRYEAIDVGPQAFRFVYRRPWESVQPEQIVEFSVSVF